MIPIQQDTALFQKNHELVFSGIADYQSTSIGKDITKSFFYGGFINDGMNTEIIRVKYLKIQPKVFF